MGKMILNGIEYISVNNINDAQASSNTTYSSEKIEELIASIPSGSPKLAGRMTFINEKREGAIGNAGASTPIEGV